MTPKDAEPAAAIGQELPAADDGGGSQVSRLCFVNVKFTLSHLHFSSVVFSLYIHE